LLLAGTFNRAFSEELTFATPDGAPVSVSSMQGRVVVLMFSGIQDPQCRDEIKALASLGERYNGRPVSVYWVSVNSDREASNDRIKRPCGDPGSVPVLRLADPNAFKRIAAKSQSLPTVVVLNKQGQPFGQPRSGFNPNSDFVNDIAQMVDSLLSQK